MINLKSTINPDALHATMCSFLGLSARDLAEIGGFSERFARDLLAGRRPFPSDTKQALEQLLVDFETIVEATIRDAKDGRREMYIYRSNEQLRSSSMGSVWHVKGKSGGGFAGLYRAAIFSAWRKLMAQGIELELLFASTPEISNQP
jgi:hypothetical protein